MDTNPELESKTQINKKLFILIILFICILAGSLAWYFFYYIKTPEYSLNIIKESIEKHDIAKFKKHVDLDSSVSRGYDDIISAMIESDKNMTLEGKTFISGFAQFFKPAVVNALKDGIFHYVETGKWEEEKNGQDTKQNINSDKIAAQSGLKSSSCKGIAYTNKDGKTAIVGIKIFESVANKEFILDIKMRELDDGTWQIAEVANLKNYILEIDKAKIEVLKKYLEDTQPIIDNHNKTIKDINSKLNIIDNSPNIPDENKKAQVRNIIENELIKDWNARFEELNNIPVPNAAKELHDLRLKVCELRLQQFRKGLEWLDTQNPQTNKEIRTLLEQANKTNQQVSNIINKVNQ